MCFGYQKEKKMPTNEQLNTFSQALLLVHEFYHRSGLVHEKVFAREVCFLGTQFLANLHGVMDENKRAMTCFLRAFQKPTLTIAWVQKYTTDPYLQSVAGAFALAALAVWFDYDFGTKVCSLDILGMTVLEDTKCPALKKYRVSFLLATKQLFRSSSKVLGTNMARLKINRPLLSQKLISHLS